MKRIKSFLAVLRNKGTKNNIIGNKGRWTCFREGLNVDFDDRVGWWKVVSRYIKQGTNRETVGTIGNNWQFWKGSREKGLPWKTLRIWQRGAAVDVGSISPSIRAYLEERTSPFPLIWSQKCHFLNLLLWPTLLPTLLIIQILFTELSLFNYCD